MLYIDIVSKSENKEISVSLFNFSACAKLPTFFKHKDYFHTVFWTNQPV